MTMPITSMVILITSATPKYLNASTHEKEEYILDSWNIEYKIVNQYTETGELRGTIKWKGENINTAELIALIYQNLKRDFTTNVH